MCCSSSYIWITVCVCMSHLIPAGAEHDSNGRSGLVERLCGGGLLQFYRPARAGETEAATTP